MLWAPTERAFRGREQELRMWREPKVELVERYVRWRVGLLKADADAMVMLPRSMCKRACESRICMILDWFRYDICVFRCTAMCCTERYKF